MPNNKILKVEIINPEKVIYKGEIQALSSINKQGRFDILPSHSNFITLIQDSLVIKIDQENTQEFKLNQGVISCFDNQIKVYIGI